MTPVRSLKPGPSTKTYGIMEFLNQVASFGCSKQKSTGVAFPAKSKYFGILGVPNKKRYSKYIQSLAVPWQVLF